MSPSLHPKARRLTWLLRHGAAQQGLVMDAAGFVSVAELCAHLRLPEPELAQILAQDQKSRFERQGERVRAAQGHSVALGSVTLDGLEASWARCSSSDLLWHGTHPDAARGIAREGILPMARTHVHLATHPDSPVGRRAGVSVLLGVSPQALANAGLTVYLSPNGVALVRRVPPDSVVAVRGRAAAEVQGLFGLSGG